MRAQHAPEELPEALRSCQQAASEGDVQAAYELGEFHYDGRRARATWPKALYWFEQASLRGHAAAQHRLGVMFFRGEGVKANNVRLYRAEDGCGQWRGRGAGHRRPRLAQMRRDELEIATQVLGQIFRDYLMQLQAADAPLIPEAWRGSRPAASVRAFLPGGAYNRRSFLHNAGP